MRIIFGHFNQLKASVFRDHLPAEGAWPIVFTKVPECVIAPGAPVRLPGAAVSTPLASGKFVLLNTRRASGETLVVSIATCVPPVYAPTV